ncbi:uncharacterized protein ELE39_000389 [Cryptosporidium sp. chipmunk genotype I]|uniref:uncharacterized protein n=1 Tax=Cryptosporidium sp. chipmunk genotype I TaxID=1280935 RepID=UPI00351AA001|nr:hypothetical protein ELE39_000389 [Cryptosporidium sp. chipmunk genotype I]
MKFSRFLQYILLPIFTFILHTFSLKNENKLTKNNYSGFDQFSLNSILGKNFPNVELTFEPITPDSIKSEFTQTINGFSKFKKDIKKHYIGENNHRYYLVAIESINKKSRFPFYGSFQTNVSCKNMIRMITYEHFNKKFVQILFNCQGNADIKFYHGKLIITTKKSKLNTIEATSYNFQDFPNLPNFLKNFRDDLFALNFKHNTDQNFQMSGYIPQYIGYLSLDSQNYDEIPNNQKYVYIPYSDKFRYIIFESQDFNYAVPIHNECHAKVDIENAVIENFCYTLRYYYDLKNGVLFYEDVDILTINIGGIRVIINERMKDLIISSKKTLYNIEEYLKNKEKEKEKEKEKDKKKKKTNKVI